MRAITYLLSKKDILDQLKREFQEIVNAFIDILEMIKDVTYGNLVNLVGQDIALLIIIGVGTIIAMIVFINIINK
jgi:hypothetical protein